MSSEALPAELDERIRADLEREHEERRERFQLMREKGRERSRFKKARAEADEESRRRQALRATFYEEKGYKRYVDSRGKEQWLLPEEYDWRVKARAAREARRDRHNKVFEQPGQNNWMVWVGIVILGLALGYVLLKS
jgi:uncharacterized membrane protein